MPSTPNSELFNIECDRTIDAVEDMLSMQLPTVTATLHSQDEYEVNFWDNNGLDEEDAESLKEFVLDAAAEIPEMIKALARERDADADVILKAAYGVGIFASHHEISGPEGSVLEIMRAGILWPILSVNEYDIQTKKIESEWQLAKGLWRHTAIDVMKVGGVIISAASDGYDYWEASVHPAFGGINPAMISREQISQLIEEEIADREAAESDGMTGLVANTQQLVAYRQELTDKFQS